jgi:uroporphyrinogen III methyltransferase/synthase
VFQTIDTYGHVRWSEVSPTGTLVVFCPVAKLGDVVSELQAIGRPEDAAVAVTADGSMTTQRTVVSTLADIACEVAAAELGDPIVMVVGDVVGERDRLSWFESKPLFGWRVLVPRTKETSVPMLTALRDYGAVPEEVPTIAVEPPRTPQQMDKAIRGLVEGRYEWIAITSSNAMRAIREKLETYGLDSRALSGLKVAAVGEPTVAALRSWGIEPDLVPSGDQTVMGLVDDWPPYDDVLDPINRVLLPRADIATETLVEGLVALGWEVDDVTAYRTVRAAPPAAEVRNDIKTGAYDAVLFTSASTVRNLVGIAGKPHAVSVIAAIGPHTAKTAEENGLRVDVLAPEPTPTDLVRALAEFAEARRAAAVEAGEPVTRPSERRPGGRRRAT